MPDAAQPDGNNESDRLDQVIGDIDQALIYAAMVKRFEKRPEWADFLNDLGEQAKTMDNLLLLQVFTAWNEQRRNQKPVWLKEDSTPSDLKSLDQQYPPDDRNEAMGPAPAPPEHFLSPRRGQPDGIS